MVPTKHYSGDYIKEDGMGGACSTYEGKVNCVGGLWLENLKVRDPLEDLSIDGTITLKCFFKKHYVRA